MEPLVLIDINSKSKNGKIYGLKSKTPHHIFLDRFYNVLPPPRMLGNKLVILEKLYQVLFEQMNKFSKPKKITVLPKVANSEQPPKKQTSSQSLDTAVKKRKVKKPSPKEIEEIDDVLNHEKKQKELIRQIFGKFNKSFEQNAHQTLKQWKQAVHKLAEELGCDLFSFRAFDKMKTYNEYTEMINNVTRYPLIVNFEMFLDLIMQQDRFCKT